MFVRALPVSYRARAFGVVQSGLQISQGIAIVLAGWVADAVAPTSVIGLSGLIGVACIGLLTISWPTPREVLDAVPEPV
jgi:MFS family permease